MKKRVFQILDEMNQNDSAKKTTTVAICNELVEAKTAKGGGNVTIGVPKEVITQLFMDERVALLLIVDKKEYDRIDQQTKDPELQKERACRVCGCTDNNCQQCVEKTGRPCHWVSEDLCSACV